LAFERDLDFIAFDFELGLLLRLVERLTRISGFVLAHRPQL
jgi:hypothetical protein